LEIYPYILPFKKSYKYFQADASAGPGTDRWYSFHREEIMRINNPRKGGKISAMFINIKIDSFFGVQRVSLISPHPCTLINLDTLTEEEFRRILCGHN
jgi:hypothetical protein